MSRVYDSTEQTPLHPWLLSDESSGVGLAGWSVLRALKADPVLLCDIPVVMLTMMEDRTRGYSLGAVDYLTLLRVGEPGGLKHDFFMMPYRFLKEVERICANYQTV